ncbi:hypothetical protein [Alteromonas sp. 14N.309.X.WAT.G.H12]|uniref:hypothetical protein n=1 Tax=Alteromonas sp. 14N.309.X.WAT.G.H12 TaxID=3120824 RepID=UPI002FD338C4
MTTRPSFWVFIFTFFVIFPASASERIYVIGYVSHPGVKSFYKEVVQEAYERLGLRVQFVEVSGERGLILLNEGLLDASTLRVESVLAPYKNIIAVQPPIAEANVNLYCRIQMICNENVLSDATKTVVTTRRLISVLMEARSDLVIKASTLRVEDLNRVIQLVSKGRYDYAIIASGTQEIPAFTTQGVNHVNLVKGRAVHALYKQHSALADAISTSIQQVLKERQSLQ